jgi:hypothetical protein
MMKQQDVLVDGFDSSFGSNFSLGLGLSHPSSINRSNPPTAVKTFYWEGLMLKCVVHAVSRAGIWQDID